MVLMIDDYKRNREDENKRERGISGRNGLGIASKPKRQNLSNSNKLTITWAQTLFINFDTQFDINKASKLN